MSNKVPNAVGSRVTVEEIVTKLSLVERGKLAGLTVVTDEKNVPPPTEGIIVSVGKDPLLADEGLIVGARVFFHHLSGSYIYVEDKKYRTLGFSEIINVLPPEEVLDEK